MSPVIIGNLTGDGAVADLIDIDVELPDSGTSVAIRGRIQRTGQATTQILGSPVTMPIGGATAVYWIIQVQDQLGGAPGTATVKSTVGGPMPTPDANNVQVFSQILPINATDPALSGGSTPDTW